MFYFQGNYGQISEEFTYEELVSLDSEGRAVMTLHEFEVKLSNLNYFSHFICLIFGFRAPKMLFSSTFTVPGMTQTSRKGLPSK